eukprot:2205499-Rhodomonas_salina.4
MELRVTSFLLAVLCLFSLRSLLSSSQVVQLDHQSSSAPPLTSLGSRLVVTLLLSGGCTWVEGLQSRQAPTHLVWVKAHVGDYGNKLAQADRAADLGCKSEDVCFHSPHSPFQLYTLEGCKMLSLHGWNKKCLSSSEAESTALCTSEHMHHSLLGQILSTLDCLTDPEILALLQIQGNSYPTASVVSSNKKGVTVCPPLAPSVMGAMKQQQASEVDCQCDWQIWLQPVTWRISSLLLNSSSSHPPTAREDGIRNALPAPLRWHHDSQWLHESEQCQCPLAIASFTPDHDGLLYDSVIPGPNGSSCMNFLAAWAPNL